MLWGTLQSACFLFPELLALAFPCRLALALAFLWAFPVVFPLPLPFPWQFSAVLSLSLPTLGVLLAFASLGWAGRQH